MNFVTEPKQVFSWLETLNFIKISLSLKQMQMCLNNQGKKKKNRSVVSLQSFLH